MSYGNWKHILGVFNFHNSAFNGISIINPQLVKCLAVMLDFFHFFFFLTKPSRISWLFCFFFKTKYYKIEWWVPNGWDWGNWGILSDEWWVTKIEWGVMSDEKKKTKQSLSVGLAWLILSTYFIIQLIFVIIHRSHCNFGYYLWVPLYYFS